MNMQAVSLVFEQFSAWQTQWLFFYTVGAALLALLASGKLERDSKGLRIALSIIFIVFAIGHIRAVRDIREQRSLLIQAVLSDQQLASFHSAVKAAEPPTKAELTAFHMAIDALVIVLFWLIPIASQSQRASKESSPET